VKTLTGFTPFALLTNSPLLYLLTMLAIQIFFMVLFLAGLFQFVDWLFSLPGKIVNWYYENRHKLK